MARSKMPLNQLQIPLSDLGRFADPEKEYVEQFGQRALNRQKELAEEANRCTCGSEKGRRAGWHKPGCPRAK